MTFGRIYSTRDHTVEPHEDPHLLARTPTTAPRWRWGSCRCRPPSCLRPREEMIDSGPSVPTVVLLSGTRRTTLLYETAGFPSTFWGPALLVVLPQARQLRRPPSSVQLLPLLLRPETAGAAPVPCWRPRSGGSGCMMATEIINEEKKRIRWSVSCCGSRRGSKSIVRWSIFYPLRE